MRTGKTNKLEKQVLAARSSAIAMLVTMPGIFALDHALKLTGALAEQRATCRRSRRSSSIAISSR